MSTKSTFKRVLSGAANSSFVQRRTIVVRGGVVVLFCFFCSSSWKAHNESPGRLRPLYCCPPLSASLYSCLPAVPVGSCHPLQAVQNGTQFHSYEIWFSYGHLVVSILAFYCFVTHPKDPKTKTTVYLGINKCAYKHSMTQDMAYLVQTLALLCNSREKQW